MREIKFRGKTTLTDKWVYGCLTRYSETLNYITEDLIEQKVYDVKTETVGQYTGLKDKNGKEIYEGDIIKYEVSFKTGRFIDYILVKWGKVEFSFLKKTSNNKFYRTTYQGLNKYGEVIGNIYENPELLGDY